MGKFRISRVHYVTGTSLEDAWRQSLYRVMEYGREYQITAGSFDGGGNGQGEKRKTLPMCIEILYPATTPLAPIMPMGFSNPPTTEESIDNYFNSLITPDKEPNQHYTYGEDIAWQVEEVIRYFKKNGFGSACGHMVVGRPESILFYNREVDLSEHIEVRDRQSQEVIWQREISNTWNKDPEVEVSSQCLRGVDVWIEDEMINFWLYFRSWNLWNGFPENLGGFQKLKAYMAAALDVEDGQMVVSGKDIHVYEHAWGIARALMKR